MGLILNLVYILTVFYVIIVIPVNKQHEKNQLKIGITLQESYVKNKFKNY